VGQEAFERDSNKYPEEKECFGMPTNHSFAYLILKNNQDRWEQKIKTKYISFLTMHGDESKVRKNKKTIVNIYFQVWNLMKTWF
jgi:hypothetical protein